MKLLVHKYLRESGVQRWRWVLLIVPRKFLIAAICLIAFMALFCFHLYWSWMFQFSAIHTLNWEIHTHTHTHCYCFHQHSPLLSPCDCLQPCTRCQFVGIKCSNYLKFTLNWEIHTHTHIERDNKRKSNRKGKFSYWD